MPGNVLRPVCILSWVVCVFANNLPHFPPLVIFFLSLFIFRTLYTQCGAQPQDQESCTLLINQPDIHPWSFLNLNFTELNKLIH